MFHVFFLHRRSAAAVGVSMPSDDLDDWQLIGHVRDGPAEMATDSLSTGDETAEPVEEQPFLYCITLVHCHKDSSRRGATIRALVLCTEHPFYMVFRPLMQRAIMQMVSGGQSSASVCERLYNAINEADPLCPVGRPVPCWGRWACTPDGPVRSCAVSYPPLVGVSEPFFEESVDSDQRRVPLHPVLQFQIPARGGAPAQVSVTQLARKFGRGIMRLFDGVLCGKRVLLVGVGVRVDVVCRMCLSVAALVSPPLPGIINSRVFPFCNFSTWSEVQSVPGFLAGTTNPTFLSSSNVHHWDLLGDIRTGAVYGSGELPEQSQNLQQMVKSSGSMRSFLTSVKRMATQPMFDVPTDASVYEHMSAMLKSSAASTEAELRRIFQTYALYHLDIALGRDYETNRREYEMLHSRISELKRTSAFAEYVQHDFGTISPKVDLAQEVRSIKHIISNTAPVPIRAVPQASATSTLNVPTEERRLADPISRSLMRLLSADLNEQELLRLSVECRKYGVFVETVLPYVESDVWLEMRTEELFNTMRHLEHSRIWEEEGE